MTTDASPAIPGRPIDEARPPRGYPSARRTDPLVSTLAWFTLALTLVVACSGPVTPGRATGPTQHQAVSAGPTSRQAAVAHLHQFQVSDACSLLTAADLSSVGVTGAGAPIKNPFASPSEPTYMCTWPIGASGGTVVLMLVYTPSSLVARANVGHEHALPLTPVRVGDYALGQFASLYNEVDFAKGSTFVAIQVFGFSPLGSKTALIAIARKVASEI